jgi:rare lipoprotein A
VTRYFLIAFSLGIGLLTGACHHSVDAAAHSKNHGRIVEAAWYKVPANSLAEKRADGSALTAASDHFKIGTLVRVTRVSNGKSVVVRITDTGLKASPADIDVCKEAAEKLDMVSDGVAKVRVERLAHD